MNTHGFARRARGVVASSPFVAPLLAVSSLTLIAGLAAHATGCGGEPEPKVAPTVSNDPRTPEQVIGELEDRLLRASALRVRATLEAEGAFASDFAGTAWVGSGRSAAMDFEDRKGGAASRVKLVSDGKTMTGGAATKTFRLETPSAMREGIVLGLVRMGLMHNVTAVSHGVPPDGIDGSARAFATLADVRRGPPEQIRGTSATPYSFSVHVRGKSMGEGVVWLDDKTFLPVQRKQTVHFKEGDLRVVETYDEVALDVQEPPERFEVADKAPEGTTVTMTPPPGGSAAPPPPAPSASGTSAKPGTPPRKAAQAGEMCGGIAGIACDKGLDCVMTGPAHPDQAGICKKKK